VRRQLAELLPQAVAFAAYEFINGPLHNDPYRVGRRLNPPLADRRSARRGAYRILYRVDDIPHAVTVLDVAHRREVCRHADLNAGVTEDLGWGGARFPSASATGRAPGQRSIMRGCGHGR